MADYERSITELNSKIKKKDDEIEDLQNEIQLLKEKNDCLHEELSKLCLNKFFQYFIFEYLSTLMVKTESV